MKHLITFLFLVFIVFACTDSNDQQSPLESPAPRYVDLSAYARGTNAGARTTTGNYAVLMAEYLTTGENEEMGNTVFFRNVGNKQLAGDFVPALSLDGTTDITYYIDANRPSNDLTVQTSSSAIDRSMTTWENVNCSNLGMTKIASDGRPTGFIAALLGYGGSFNYVADVTHNGWLPGAFFNLLAAGGSNFILGVTFTIVFIDNEGNLIDTDNNGKYDVAWREIYYNDNFTWKNGATYDIETVSLHESGHGLSQAHFGKAFRNSGGLHFSPRAVMNAAYSGVQTEIGHTDNAGHCSNWGAWPGN
jgi:hypothetical protein